MGIPAAVEGKNGGKPPGGGTEVGSDGKVSGDEGKKAISDIFRPVFGGRNLLNGGQESFSFLCQADAVAGPGEEGKSDFLFQAVHHAGNAGGGVARFFSGGGEASGLQNAEKDSVFCSIHCGSVIKNRIEI